MPENFYRNGKNDFEIDFKRIGKLVRQARTNLNMTQEQLSEEVDVTPAFIGHIERAERSASLATIVKLAACLNLSLDELFGLERFSESDEASRNFASLMAGRTEKTKQAALDMVRALLRYMP